MDIPSTVIAALRSLDNSVTRDQLECILSHVDVSIRGPNGATSVSAGCHSAGYHGSVHSCNVCQKQGQVVDAIVSLFKRACKCGISLESECGGIRSILESARVRDDAQTVIVEKYQGIRVDLLGQVDSYALTSLPIQQVVDADYRQEFIVSNSDLDKVSSISYLISLKTLPQAGQSRTNGLQSDMDSIDFTCSLQDLQDLVTKLREASKCLENVIK